MMLRSFQYQEGKGEEGTFILVELGCFKVQNKLRSQAFWSPPPPLPFRCCFAGYLQFFFSYDSGINETIPP